MKPLAVSFRSASPACVFLAAGSGILGGACGGSGGDGSELRPENLISDFEGSAGATVTMDGNPPRNGRWFAYNDDNPKGTDPSCAQTPPSDTQRAPDPPAAYLGSPPPSGRPGTKGSQALHAQWSGCSAWGAGIGADLNDPTADGGTGGGTVRTKTAYDVTPFRGVTFWALSGASSAASLRLKFPMTDEAKVSEGGNCDETMVGAGKCSDDFGEPFTLPAGGSWKQFTIKWSDPTFNQVGWGAHFPWNPTHVTSIQIESVDVGSHYDFWVDDIYFIN